MNRSLKVIENEKEQITASFNDLLKNAKQKIGLTKEEFETVTVDIFGFSKYCNSLLFDKILSGSTFCFAVPVPNILCRPRKPVPSKLRNVGPQMVMDHVYRKS